MSILNNLCKAIAEKGEQKTSLKPSQNENFKIKNLNTLYNSYVLRNARLPVFLFIIFFIKKFINYNNALLATMPLKASRGTEGKRKRGGGGTFL